MKLVWKDDPWIPETLGNYFIYDNARQKKVCDKIALTEINGTILPFYLNRFAERYMSPGTIDFTTGVTLHPTMWCNLSIKPSDYQEAKSEIYVNGYDGEFQNVLSNPVNGKLDPRMKYLWTYAGEQTIDIDITDEEDGDYQNDYLTMKFYSDGTICFTHRGPIAPDEKLSVEYSKNDEDWVTVENIDVTTISVMQGDIIRWKGSNLAYGTNNEAANSCFSGSAIFNVYGNILSLIYDTDFKRHTSATLSNGAFAGLFYESNVYDASNLYLKFGTVNSYSLLNTFRKCPYLTKAPKALYAYTVGSIGTRSMFKGCTNLTQPMNLYVSNLVGFGNFANLYDGCTALVNPPIFDVGDNLTIECFYGTFSGCTSLTKAPDLTANRAVMNTENGSYRYMFYGCSSLTYVKCLLGRDYDTRIEFTKWLTGVPATGTFVKYSRTAYETGGSGIPAGWTIENI